MEIVLVTRQSEKVYFLVFSLVISPDQAAKVRAVFNMLGQFVLEPDGMAQKIRQLEVIVNSNRHLSSLNGKLSQECLATAIDMIRSKCFFAIRPHDTICEHPSVLVRELQSLEADSVNHQHTRSYEQLYKHFEGISFSVLKA